MSIQLSANEARIADFAALVPVKLADRIDSISSALLNGIRQLISVGSTSFERRESLTLLYDTISIYWVPLTLCKVAQELLGVENFLLIMVIAGMLPFLFALRMVFTFIPCPRMAAIVSNSALLAILVVLIIFSNSSYGNAWETFVYCQMIWLWLVVASMLARLHIGRNKELNHLNPLFHTPLIGFIGSASLVCMLLALKKVTLTDCVLLACLDPLLTGIVSVFFFPQYRSKIHGVYIRTYVFLLSVVSLYFLDINNSLSSTSSGGFGFYHILFLLGRGLQISRSQYLKWSFMTVADAHPPIDEGKLFASSKDPPVVFGFKGFPAPVLSRIDYVFFSGLADTDMHAIGPEGTRDLYMLADFTYQLPVMSLACWVFEQIGTDTLKHGLSSAEPVPRPADLIYFILIFVCVSMFLQPWAISRKLFDRGSTVDDWVSRPILLIVPFLAIDWLYCNYLVSRLQIVLVIVGMLLVGLNRADLLKRFNKRKILKAAQQLAFYQPSAMRDCQKTVLLDFESQASSSDFTDLLLATAVQHGNNIKELSKDVHGAVWDPKPSATAAWKLAGSLVKKALRKHKLAKQDQANKKLGMVEDIKELVLSICDDAVDESSGDGERILWATKMADRADKLKVFSRLSELVHSNRHKRSLAKSLMSQRVSGASIRPMPVDQSSSIIPGVVFSPKRPSIVSQQTPRKTIIDENQIIIPLSSRQSSENIENTSSTTNPMEFRRVVTHVESLPIVTPSSASVLLSFGDDSLSQCGASALARATHVVCSVDSLRGAETVSLFTGGSCSFAVTESGKANSWGSNRTLELGFREELRRTHDPQIIKILRDHEIVQIASSPAIVGQSHTACLTSTGQVFTFGSSSEGALGQGESVIRTSPVLVKLTTAVKMKQVACGLRHTIMLDVTGGIWVTGDNKLGQLGVRGLSQTFSPINIEGLSRIKFIASGESHVIAVDEDNCLWAWGQNSCGQLGNGTFVDQFCPVKVGMPNVTDIVSIACGSQHSLAVTDGGRKVLAWGNDSCGQLGVAAPLTQSGESNRPWPVILQSISMQSNRRIIQVAAAGSHTLILDVSGEVLVCGDNTYGQLGFLPPGHPQAGVVSPGTKFTAHQFDGRKAIPVLTTPPALKFYRALFVATADKHSLCLSLSA